MEIAFIGELICSYRKFISSIMRRCKNNSGFSGLSLLDSSLLIYVCITIWLDEDVQDGIIKEADGIVVMNYSKGNERINIEEEMEMVDEYGKSILTAYELQPVGEYGLEEYNTYYKDGLDAVEEMYQEQFSGTDVGIASHNLNMMRKLDK